jgi:hypothetical protein
MLLVRIVVVCYALRISAASILEIEAKGYPHPQKMPRSLTAMGLPERT